MWPAQFYKNLILCRFSSQNKQRTHICKFHKEDRYRVLKSTKLKVFGRRTLMLARNLKDCLGFWINHKLFCPLFLLNKVRSNALLTFCTFALIIWLCLKDTIFLPMESLFKIFGHSNLSLNFVQFDLLHLPLLDSLKTILNLQIFQDANSDKEFLWNHLKMLWAHNHFYFVKFYPIFN